MDKNSRFISISNLDIPLEWEDFDKFSQIKKLSDTPPETGTGCLYKAKKGHTFDWHKHKASEAAIVIGEATMYWGEEKTLFDSEKIINITDKRTYKTGESYYIPENILHKVFFEEDSLLILFWHPPFPDEKWTADFLQKDKEKVNSLYNVLKEKVNNNFI
jgi:quercetin dioxygenase-like cupin family protein